MIALLVLGSLVIAPATCATSPSPGSGTATITGWELTSSRTAGGNTLTTEVLRFTLIGTCESQNRGVYHPNRTYAGQGASTFTGSANGVPGTLVQRVVFAGDLTTGAFEGRNTSIGGTGGLASFHDVGTFQGVGGGWTYESEYHFDP